MFAKDLYYVSVPMKVPSVQANRGYNIIPTLETKKQKNKLVK